MDIGALFPRQTRPLMMIATVLSLAVVLLVGCSSGGGASTTTALSSGPATSFEMFAQRFEALIAQGGPAGTLPLAVIPAEELSWLSAAAKPLTVTDVKGYRLVNGDSVILFFATPDFFTATQEVQSQAFPAADKSIMAAMQDKYPGTSVLVSHPDLGLLVVSEKYANELTSLAQAARLGQSPVGLSTEQRQQLDSLDAAGVIRTYFETSDPRVIYYLSAPHEQAIMTSPNYVGEQRHEGDIADLTLDGPTGIDPRLDAYPRTDWPIQEQFGVNYDLLVPRDTEGAGHQTRFAYVGRQTPDSPWRVMGAGTGP